MPGLIAKSLVFLAKLPLLNATHSSTSPIFCMMRNLSIVTILFACGLMQDADAGGTTSRLQVHLPVDLRRTDGYDHREALFGLPPYGGAIQQNVYYADSSLCEDSVDYTRGGFPTRDKDGSGQMKPWKAPFILMVDRGECTFVKKVRNAQRSGAVAVIIADTTCLCHAGDECTPEEENEPCEAKEPIMADDGSGGGITVPSFLMFKQDADPVKKTLKENTVVRMQMSWELPSPGDTVDYSIWTTPKEYVSKEFLVNWRDVAVALGDRASFTPHMYIYDGVFDGCQGEDGENECYNLCTNDGRYCSTDPDDDLDKGLSGADVVTESLRRLCVWQEFGNDGVGEKWWNYLEEFNFRCDTDAFFNNPDCISDAMGKAGIESSRIEKCMKDSGGLEENVDNMILGQELANKEASGVVILPSFFVNGAPLRGAITVNEIFEAVCAGFAAESQPKVCELCNKCYDTLGCIRVGHCKGEGAFDTVSLPVFTGTLLGVVLCFSALGVVQWQRSQRQMRSQVRGIMAEYMPVDESTKVESLGIPSDDFDDEMELN